MVAGFPVAAHDARAGVVGAPGAVACGAYGLVLAGASIPQDPAAAVGFVGLAAVAAVAVAAAVQAGC